MACMAFATHSVGLLPTLRDDSLTRFEFGEFGCPTHEQLRKGKKFSLRKLDWYTTIWTVYDWGCIGAYCVLVLRCCTAILISFLPPPF